MNYRHTLQKDFILREAEQLNHPTAEEVYNAVAEKYPSISKATVYRNLNQMAENGKLLKVRMMDGADCFDTRVVKHYHIRCKECGKVYDVDMPYLENLEKNVPDKHGFDFQGHEIVFIGVCPDCQ